VYTNDECIAANEEIQKPRAERALRTAKCAKQIADALIEPNRQDWNEQAPYNRDSNRCARAEVLRRNGGLRAQTDDGRLRLERRIRAHLPPCALSIVLTDNRYTMISVKRMSSAQTGGAPSYKVRLHHMFAKAEPYITHSLALYIWKNDRRASKVLGDFIDENQDRVRGERRSRPRIDTKGTFHDLQDIFNELNTQYFRGKINARISWGQRTGKVKRRNSIKMGSYAVEDRFIRIHRALDRAFVPRFFVEWVVFHEMLHQVHTPKIVNGRRCFHPKAFLSDEALFEHYEKAKHWEYTNLDRLLTY